MRTTYVWPDGEQQAFTSMSVEDIGVLGASRFTTHEEHTAWAQVAGRIDYKEVYAQVLERFGASVLSGARLLQAREAFRKKPAPPEYGVVGAFLTQVDRSLDRRETTLTFLVQGQDDALDATLKQCDGHRRVYLVSDAASDAAKLALALQILKTVRSPQ